MPLITQPKGLQPIDEGKAEDEKSQISNNNLPADPQIKGAKEPLPKSLLLRESE